MSSVDIYKRERYYSPKEEFYQIQNTVDILEKLCLIFTKACLRVEKLSEK